MKLRSLMNYIYDHNTEPEYARILKACGFTIREIVEDLMSYRGCNDEDIRYILSRLEDNK